MLAESGKWMLLSWVNCAKNAWKRILVWLCKEAWEVKLYQTSRSQGFTVSSCYVSLHRRVFVKLCQAKGMVAEYKEDEGRDPAQNLVAKRLSVRSFVP